MTNKQITEAYDKAMRWVNKLDNVGRWTLSDEDKQGMREMTVNLLDAIDTLDQSDMRRESTAEKVEGLLKMREVLVELLDAVKTLNKIHFYT